MTQPIELKPTGKASVTAASDGAHTISVPVQFKRRARRTVVTLPGGEATQPRPWDATPSPMQLALARGHRWVRMLETGEARQLLDIAKREKLDNSYVSRMVNLTLLAPDIIEAVLNETLPPETTLFDLAVDPPLDWNEQRRRAGLVAR